jgi:hypothetical protein
VSIKIAPRPRDASTSDAKSGQVVAQYKFATVTNYALVDGTNASYSGTFRGRNGTEALQRARDFVIKYFRPQSITGGEVRLDDQ